MLAWKPQDATRDFASFVDSRLTLFRTILIALFKARKLCLISSSRYW